MHPVPANRKLVLYALFKQATQGDAPAHAKPGHFAGMEAKAKYLAWEEVKGKTKEECWKAYIEELQEQKSQFL